MQATDVLTALSVVLALAVVFSAARYDLKTREISDIHWGILGFGGALLYFLYSFSINGFTWESAAVTAAMVSALAGIVFLEGRISAAVCILSLAVTAVTHLAGNGSDLLLHGEIAVALSFLYVLCYYLGIIRGGADAKCLIALSMDLPFYIADPGVPSVVSAVFAPSVSVLFAAAVLSVAGCSVYCLIRNRGRKGMGGYRFHGYYAGIDEAEKSFCWPAEDIVDGRLQRTQIPDDEEVKNVCARLRDNGVSEVLVTPMIPFIVPVFFALTGVLLFGSPFFIL